MFYWSRLHVLPIRKITGFIFLLIFKEEGEDGKYHFRKRSIICHLPVTVMQLRHFLQTWNRPDRMGEVGALSDVLSAPILERRSYIVHTEVTSPGTLSWLVPSPSHLKIPVHRLHECLLSMKLSVLAFLSPGIVSTSALTQMIWMLFSSVGFYLNLLF